MKNKLLQMELIRQKMRSKKITSSSRGKPCTLNIAGVCNYDTETTVFCHLPDESHGMGIKAIDISGCDGCSACHDVLDGRVQCEEFERNRYFYIFRAFKRTLLRWLNEGVIRVA